MDVYIVTYSDDYDILDMHGWTITSWMISFSLYIYILFMVSGMAMICIDCSPIFLCRRYADCLRAGASVGLLWPTHFLWMTAARCANAAAGMFTGGQMT